MSRGIRVLVADGHSILRTALVMAVHMSDELVLAGEASTASQVFELCRDATPEIVLVGSHLPGMSVSAAVAKLCAECPALRLIAIARYEGGADAHELVRAGARGFVLRDRLTAELLPAIRAVAAGQYYFPAEFGFLAPPGSETAATTS
jgi:DNA-binding NarL/FixJ family response regulator